MELDQQLAALVAGYNACDIADVLLKLNVKGAGFLPDLFPLSHFRPQTAAGPPTPAPIAAPISTILFVPKSHSTATTATTSSTACPPTYPAPNLAPSTHWTDHPAPGTITLIQQPPAQHCAVVGDILATRLSVRGVKGIVVDGRIRDLAAQEGLVKERGFGVWSRGTSAVGSGLEAKAWAGGVEVVVGGVRVRPGDIMFVDAAEMGVVVIPRDKLDQVIEMLPAVKAADDAVVEEVLHGMDVAQAFKKHRGA